MATKDTVVQELVVNTLTHKQFKAAQEAGTLSPYELYGTPDTSVRLPVLTPMWFDHIANDVSWLRADTFSWQSGDVYVAAYEHLLADNSSKKVWTHFDVITSEDSSVSYVVKRTSTFVGEPVYDYADNDNYGYEIIGVVGKITAFSGDGVVTVQFLDGSTNTFFPNGSLTIGAKIDEINGIFIHYKLADDGHKICLPDQENNVAALYEATGVAWYYILDTENKQFKLPRGKHNKYADTLGVVGNGMALGITNGTNTAGIVNDSQQKLHAKTNAYGANVGTAESKSDLGGVADTILGITPDPEKSGIVAQQTQDTDQYKYLYFYVGNFEQDSVEQTAGIKAEMFNGKADVDLGNIPANYDYVLETQLPAADNGYTWYRKYKSGWVEQGGLVSIAASATSITLPIEMANVFYTIVFGGTSYSSSSYDPASINIKEGTQATTGFSVQSKNQSGQSYANDAYWQVSGMSGQ